MSGKAQEVEILPEAAFERRRRGPGFNPSIHPKRTAAVLGLIMEYAPPGEQLEESVARLCRAVARLGFPCVTAFAAFLAYRKFPKLQQHYEQPT